MESRRPQLDEVMANADQIQQTTDSDTDKLAVNEQGL